MKNTIKKRRVKIIISTTVLLLAFVGNSTATVASLEKSEKILYNISIVEKEKIENMINAEGRLKTPLQMVKEQMAEESNAVAVMAAVETLAVVEEEVPTYSQEDLNLLARLIFNEAGSDNISDRQQQLVGMVVINRTNSEYFPNTIYDVIYQKGQYSCVGNSIWENDPPQRSIDNAKLVLEGKVSAPSNVLFQAEFLQGDGIYEQFDNISTTTYFCYVN